MTIDRGTEAGASTIDDAEEARLKGEFFDLVNEAGASLRRVHELEIRRLHPLLPMTARDHNDLARANRDLDEISLRAGTKAHEGLPEPGWDEAERSRRHFFVGHMS